MSVTTAAYEAKVKEFQKLENELSDLGQKRAQLQGQLQENKMVKEEFDKIEEDGKIFKLIGPVLVKQDETEANENVMKRIEYLQAEMCFTSAILCSLQRSKSIEKASSEKVAKQQELRNKKQQQQSQIENMRRQQQQQAMLQQAQAQQAQQQKQQKEAEDKEAK